MSVSVSLNLTAHQHEPATRILTLDDGRTFLSVHFGSAASVILDGFDDRAIDNARALAMVLTTAADELEKRIQSERDHAEPPDPDGEDICRDYRAEERDAMDAARRLK